MGVATHVIVLACGLILPLAQAMAQSEEDMVVRRIVVEGAARTDVEGALQITLRGADGKENHRIAVGQAIAPGTRIATGAAVLIEVARTRPALHIVLEPRTRLTVQRNTSNATQVDLADGKASFDLLARLDFYFGVSTFRKVFAIARGTQFSVDTSRSCTGGDIAACVTIKLDEGRLELETRRPVVLDDASATTASDFPGRDKPTTGEDDTVSVVDTMAAGQTRTFALDPAQFALRFETLSQADSHFAADLQRARDQGDPQGLRRALRNRLVILRLGDRNAEASALAAEGLQIAKSSGDRLWEFRFLIDQAFSIWKQKRDRSALSLFEQAFGMTDVTVTPDTSADLAALYARYGGIRFDARNRERPEEDVNAAEDYTRRALRLREPQGGDRPTLDLSWSHYSLGVLLRIARDDYAAANRHFERAIEIRREILGSRDDIATAEMLAEAAIAKDLLVRERANLKLANDDILVDEFAQVRLRFEESLGMLSRLSPGDDHRSIGAIARRMADFQRRLGEWFASLEQPLGAVAEYRAAEVRYNQALAVFARVLSNTSAERRFAYRGLGQTKLLMDQPDAAAQALGQAFAIALQERCSTPPSPEAPSSAWINDLLELLANAAERSGDAAAAIEYRRQLGSPDVPLPCHLAEKPAPSPAEETR